MSTTAEAGVSSSTHDDETPAPDPRPEYGTTPGALRRPATTGRVPHPAGPKVGQMLRHSTGAIIVAANHSDGTPPDPRFPCWCVIWGSHLVGDKAWLHPTELATIPGSWTPVGDALVSVERSLARRAAR